MFLFIFFNIPIVIILFAQFPLKKFPPPVTHISKILFLSYFFS